MIVQALRDSPAYDSFLRRWKLSVYFSLRFQVHTVINNTQSSSGMFLIATCHPAGVHLQQAAVMDKAVIGSLISYCSAQQAIKLLPWKAVSKPPVANQCDTQTLSIQVHTNKMQGDTSPSRNAYEGDAHV